MGLLGKPTILGSNHRNFQGTFVSFQGNFTIGTSGKPPVNRPLGKKPRGDGILSLQNHRNLGMGTENPKRGFFGQNGIRSWNYVSRNSWNSNPYFLQVNLFISFLNKMVQWSRELEHARTIFEGDLIPRNLWEILCHLQVMMLFCVWNFCSELGRRQKFHLADSVPLFHNRTVLCCVLLRRCYIADSTQWRASSFSWSGVWSHLTSLMVLKEMLVTQRSPSYKQNSGWLHWLRLQKGLPIRTVAS